MQYEDQDFTISPEMVERAINVIKVKNGDINPFTVADALNVPSATIYKHFEIMKMIIAARSNNHHLISAGEVVDKVPSVSTKLQGVEERAPVLKENGHNQIIVNYGGYSTKIENHLNRLTQLTWREIETIYSFRTVTSKEYAVNLFVDTRSNRIKAEDSQTRTVVQVQESSLDLARDTGKQAQELFDDLESKSTALNQEVSDDSQAKMQNFVLVEPEEIKEADPIAHVFSGIRTWADLELRMQATQAQSVEPELAVQEKDAVFVEENIVSNEFTPDNTETKEEIKLLPLLVINTGAIQTSAEPVMTDIDTQDIEIISQEAEQLKESDLESRDELRDIIQSHIKNASEQIAELNASIGKEFYVLNNADKHKFVGSVKAQENGEIEDKGTDSKNKENDFKPKSVPPEVRKACLILGVRPDNITYQGVQEAWKKSMAAPGTHPDQGGDAEVAVFLNTAKDVLMRFLDIRAPKLGKKFGPFKTENSVKDNEKKT